MCERFGEDKLCVSKLCDDKLCVDKLCVSDLVRTSCVLQVVCGQVVGRRGGRRRRRRRRDTEPKTRTPHKDVGKKC